MHPRNNWVYPRRTRDQAWGNSDTGPGRMLDRKPVPHPGQGTPTTGLARGHCIRGDPSPCMCTKQRERETMPMTYPSPKRKTNPKPQLKKSQEPRLLSSTDLTKESLDVRNSKRLDYHLPMLHGANKESKNVRNHKKVDYHLPSSLEPTSKNNRQGTAQG